MQPEGFNDGTANVCRLKKAMYGLKQSPRQWNKKLHEALLSFGLRRSKMDPCVYVQGKQKELNLIVTIYVDDFLIVWKKESDRDKIKSLLSSTFKMKDLGTASNCVGLHITRNSNGNYFIDQKQYIQSVIDKFNMNDCRPVGTPSDTNKKLSKAMSPKSPEDIKQMENVPYQMLVGALLYLVQGTRPDIAFAVSEVSRYNNCFGHEHWTAAK